MNIYEMGEEELKKGVATQVKEESGWYHFKSKQLLYLMSQRQISLKAHET